MFKVLLIIFVGFIVFPAYGESLPNLCDISKVQEVKKNHNVEYKENGKFLPVKLPESDVDLESNVNLSPDYKFEMKADLADYYIGKYSDYLGDDVDITNVVVKSDGKIFFGDEDVTQKILDSCNSETGHIVPYEIKSK